MAEFLVRVALIAVGCVTMFALSTLGYVFAYEFDRLKTRRLIRKRKRRQIQTFNTAPV